MITLASGATVGRTLVRATSTRWNYSQVPPCSPFSDRALALQLEELCEAADKARCAVTIVTNRRADDFLAALCRDRRYVRLLIRDRLHTKAYPMLGRNGGRYSEALVTSANLTRAGVSTNHEWGVHIRCTSANGRHLIRQLNNSLRRLTSQRV
jgi:hypothetical protein